MDLQLLGRWNLLGSAGRRIVAGCLLCGLLSGCGAREYESRLTETVKYLQYIDMLNESLSGTEWSASSYNVKKFRVPKQLELIPPPADPNSTFDSRQPDYLEWKIPGLLGAWWAQVAVEADGAEQLPCYMYVASNHHMFLDTSLVEHALEFHATVVSGLTDALGMGPNPAIEWDEERHPPAGGYVSQKAYSAATLYPQRQIHGVQYEFAIYLHQQKDVQVAVIFVIPRDVSRSEQLAERIALSLETLEVSPDTPRKGGGQGNGGEPVGGGPAF